MRNEPCEPWGMSVALSAETWGYIGLLGPASGSSCQPSCLATIKIVNKHKDRDGYDLETYIHDASKHVIRCICYITF